MIQVRWDTLFLSLLHGNPPVGVRPAPPEQPTFTKESAHLVQQLLVHHTASAFCRILGPDPVYFLDQDTVIACKPVDGLFWEKIGPVWTEEALTVLWAHAVTTNQAISPIAIPNNLPGYPWLLLRWRGVLNRIRAGAGLWFPDEAWCLPTSGCYDTPVQFYLRVEITQAVCALLGRHHDMWHTSVQDKDSLAAVLNQAGLNQAGKPRYPWADIDSWLKRIRSWCGESSLSYEDGDFLLSILRHSNAYNNWDALQRYHSEHGLAFFSDKPKRKDGDT